MAGEPERAPPEPGEVETISNARRILMEIERSPGVHQRELQRRLDLPTGVIEYHLHRLAKERLVVERKEGGYTRYFPERGLGEEERKVLSFLRQETPRLVILFLLDSPGARHGDILRSLDISGATLTHHLKRMVAGGVLVELHESGTRYRVAKPDEARRMLVTYRQSFFDAVVDQIVAAWESR